ncbi:Methionine aminopeptidase 1 [compost metagenome]
MQTLVEANGLSVVRDYVGHGIGRQLHEPPQVPNYGTPGTGPVIKPGMAFAIEPMVNVGGAGVKVLANKWTVVTRDKSWSAHFEHSVLATPEGPYILTREEGR